MLFDHDGSVAIHTCELDSSGIGLIVKSDLNVDAWMRTEIYLNESEIELNESEIDLNESEIDLNECEPFLKAILDRTWHLISELEGGPNI